MDPLAHRVATRFLRASLGREFEQRFDKLLSYAPDNPPPAEVKEFRKWISENFKLTGRVPAEAKRARDELERFWRFLEHAEGHGLMPGVFAISFAESWHHLKPYLPTIVQSLSTESGKVIVFEKKVGSNTFVNMVGASESRFDSMISAIETVFGGLSGWRKKAVDGGVRVVFAGPKDFPGTASGKYRSDKDELWIRATPGGRIDKGGNGYGGLPYVITHELGHRYERKHHQPFDFDTSGWYTTPYSHKDGEAFAELFALSNFGIKGQWGPRLDTFEHLMTTGKMPSPAAIAV
jgi:hypothetical protein